MMRSDSVKRRARTRPRQPRRIGFTLIEVLVVVAIIAMLLAILLPSLKKARAQARVTACNANLHDFGTALQIYAQEQKLYFPPTPYVGSAAPDTKGDPPWGPGDDNMFILWYAKYAKDINLFSCPATTYRVRVPDKVERKPAVNGFKYEITTAGVVDLNDFENIAQKVSSKGFGTSYEYNVWYTRGIDMPRVDWYWGKAPWVPPNDDDHALWRGRKLKRPTLKFPIPAYGFLMHEADEGGTIIGAPANFTALNNWPEPWDNHGSLGMNILFMDGHAEFIKGQDNIDHAWARQDATPPGSGGGG